MVRHTRRRTLQAPARTTQTSDRPQRTCQAQAGNLPGRGAASAFCLASCLHVGRSIHGRRPVVPYEIGDRVIVALRDVKILGVPDLGGQTDAVGTVVEKPGGTPVQRPSGRDPGCGPRPGDVYRRAPSAPSRVTPSSPNPRCPSDAPLLGQRPGGQGKRARPCMMRGAL